MKTICIQMYTYACIFRFALGVHIYNCHGYVLYIYKDFGTFTLKRTGLPKPLHIRRSSSIFLTMTTRRTDAADMRARIPRMCIHFVHVAEISNSRNHVENGSNVQMELHVTFAYNQRNHKHGFPCRCVCVYVSEVTGLSTPVQDLSGRMPSSGEHLRPVR